MAESGDLLSHVLIPVASEEDAKRTCEAALPRIKSEGGRVTALHVIEKAGGAIDKAPVEQREAMAKDIFEVVGRECREAGVDFETELRYGTDVVETIFDAAADVDATAVAFTPREGSRWIDLLTGDRSRAMVKRADIPVIVLPHAEE